MSAIIPSLGNGLGGGILAFMVQGFHMTPFLGKVPKFKEAFLFTVTVSLVDRSIEHVVKEDFKNQALSRRKAVLCTTVLVGIKILIPYVLRSPYEDFFQCSIPRSYIHLQNALYFTAIVDGEFENIAKRMFQSPLSDHSDRRLFVGYINFVAAKIIPH